MSASPNISISMVSVEVPIDLPAAEAKRRPMQDIDCTVSLELGHADCQVWDNVTFTACGKHYPYDRAARPAYRMIYDGCRLTDIPYFPLVFRYLSEQYVANRANPLGAFLRTVVFAMERDLAERDGSSVYFAEADGRVKIGWSSKVATRIAQLQTGNASPIRLLAIEPGGRALERQLHERFADARVGGEWFALTPDLQAYVAALSRPVLIAEGAA